MPDKTYPIEVSAETHRQYCLHRVKFGLPACKIAEMVLKAGSYILDNLDRATSFAMSDDAATIVYGKLFREKLAKKGFDSAVLEALDRILIQVEASLMRGEKQK